MRSVNFENGRVFLASLDTPRPEPGQARVRVLMAGICGTDLELLEGYYGFAGVPGHEFVGRVVEAPGHAEWEGRRVAADINIGCGRCEMCRRGNRHHCPERKVIGIKGWPGAFAEELLVPVENLYAVDDALPDESAVFAEPLAAVLRIADKFDLAGKRIAILGDGRLGRLAALALRAFAPETTLVGRRESFPAERVRWVKSGPGESPAALRSRLGDFDLVVEATGRPEGLDYALALIRTEGVIVAKTTSREPSRLNLADLVVREIRLIGSRCGDIGRALKFMEKGMLDPRPLIGAVYPFEKFEEAFERSRRKGAGKVLLKIGRA